MPLRRGVKLVTWVLVLTSIHATSLAMPRQVIADPPLYEGPKPSAIIEPLLEWYDSQKRVLPWRAKNGTTPDPYAVWLSEIMLQQTTVQAVIPYFERFFSHYPTIHDLAAAPLESVLHDWAGLGYYSRARNLHACAQYVVAKFGGQFPSDVDTLKTLKGIGPYTAGAICAIAFNKQAVVIDGNVERVLCRLYGLVSPLPAVKTEIKAVAAPIYFSPANTAPADLPQAFMDLGARVCIPANPRCALCPLTNVCVGYKAGIAASLPKRTPKKPLPQRVGILFVVRNKSGDILTVKRPDSGLFGGMRAYPTTDFVSADILPAVPDYISKVGKHIGEVRHVFTHFALTLQIVEATAKNPPDDHKWMPHAELSTGLPSLFKKAWRLMEA